MQYIRLGRNLLDTKEEDFARFTGEWDPTETTGWETFTVMLHGSDAGDIIEITWADLETIMAAR